MKRLNKQKWDPYGVSGLWVGIRKYQGWLYLGQKDTSNISCFHNYNALKKQGGFKRRVFNIKVDLMEDKRKEVAPNENYIEQCQS